MAYRRIVERERRARKEAERLLEDRSRELYLADAELKRIARRLDEVEERQRRDVAVALHDGIGQNLALARHHLGKLAVQLPDGQHATVAFTLTLLDDSIRQLRATLADLSPAPLYELGLVAALRSLTRSINERHAVTCNFTQTGTLPTIEQDLALVLYRACRELAINCIKHAQATTIDIDLEVDDAKLRLSVTDDGKGFDPSTVAGGESSLGLRSVRQRIGWVGGAVTIDSEPDEGSQVMIEVPLTASATREGRRLRTRRTDQAGEFQ
jgi:signal transduction histidine kinase